MIYVVLGMHKSGTTLVSQILHHSGIDMGEFDESVSYDKGNKYEREATLALDMDILGAPDFEVLDLTPGGTPAMSEAQRRRMRAIIADCQAAHADWGFKDPRAALLYELWVEELPAHKVIAIFRDPAEVWPRFKWLGKRKYHTNFARAYTYLQRWQEHNSNIVRCLRQGKAEHIMLGYRELMTDDREFARLQEFVGRPLTDRRKPGLYRNRSPHDVFLRAAEGLLSLRGGPTTAQTLADLAAMRA